VPAIRQAALQNQLDPLLLADSAENLDIEMIFLRQRFSMLAY